MVTFDFLVQLYLLPERKRNRKKGYGRIVAERPTGSRAGCQSASGGSRTPRPVRTTVRPKPMSHHADRQPDHCPLKEKGGLGGLLRELNLSSSVSPTRTSQLVPPQRANIRNSDNFHFHQQYLDFRAASSSSLSPTFAKCKVTSLE